MERKKSNLLAVDDKLVAVGADLALELAMGGVVLEHVDHVVERNERIVDGDHGHALVNGGAEDEASNSTKSIDSDLGHDDGLRAWLRLRRVGGQGYTEKERLTAKVVRFMTQEGQSKVKYVRLP